MHQIGVAAGVLVRQPQGFERLRMGQEVADANDLPRSQVEDLADLLIELDAGRPGGQVQVTQREDRLAEVAELLGPIGEAFPRLAAILPPDLSRAAGTSVGGRLSLEARLDRRVPLHVGIELGQEGVQIVGVPRLDGAPDGLHVLPGHSPPSIACSGPAAILGAPCRRRTWSSPRGRSKPSTRARPTPSPPSRRRTSSGPRRWSPSRARPSGDARASTATSEASRTPGSCSKSIV